MSALPHHDDDHSNVTDMGDFVRKTYEAAIQIDQWLHGMIASLRSQMVALELANDPDIATRIAMAESDLSAGNLERVISADEFRERYLTP